MYHRDSLKIMKLKINITKKGAIISLSVIIGAILVDLFSKIAVMKNMKIGQTVPLIKDVLHLTYITNEGAAFGSFSEHRWVFMTLSSLLIIFLAALILIWEDADALFYTAASMVLGGGVGNMIDRIAYGKVIDFIDFRALPELWYWIFNFADSFVCVGAGLLILWYIRAEVRAYKKEKAKKTEETENGGEDTK